MRNKYIKLNNEQLRKLQLEMLPLLIEVDRICTKHNIRYFIAGGTLIGAIRHKGFIPWDDDVDVHMLREDYERFCKVCENELDTARFFFQNQKTDKHYNWLYGKLRLKNTSYIRAGQEHLKQKNGIFMDIGPIDNASSGKFKRWLSIFICKMCRKILWSPVGKKTANNPIKRILYQVLNLVPRGLVIFIAGFFSKIESRQETPLLVCHNVFGQVFKREWYAETINVEFEGYNFQAPKRYDDLLTCMYGEYMKLPPEDQRQGHCMASFIKFLDGTELKV